MANILMSISTPAYSLSFFPKMLRILKDRKGDKKEKLGGKEISNSPAEIYF